MKNVVVQFSSKLDGPFLIVMFRIFEFYRLGMLSRGCWLVKQLRSAKQLHTLKYLVKVALGTRDQLVVETSSMFQAGLLGQECFLIEYFFIYSDFRAHPYHSHIFPFPINWKFKESRRTWEHRWDVFSKARWSYSDYKVSPVNWTETPVLEVVSVVEELTVVRDSGWYLVMLMVGSGCPASVGGQGQLSHSGPGLELPPV